MIDDHPSLRWKFAASISSIQVFIRSGWTLVCILTVSLFLWHVQNQGQHIWEVCAFRMFLNALGYCIGIWRLSLQLLLRWWHLLDSFASDWVTFHARLRILLQVFSGGDVSHLLSARLLRTLYSATHKHEEFEMWMCWQDYVRAVKKYWMDTHVLLLLLGGADMKWTNCQDCPLAALLQPCT
jgi:hypothetical protein